MAKSGYGWFMEGYATITTVTTTTTISVFIINQMRPPHKQAAPLYTLANMGIFIVLVQKTIDSTIYGNINFGIIWIAMDTIHEAVCDSFEKVWWWRT